MRTSILHTCASEEGWQDFLNYKIEKQHLPKAEEEQIRQFIGRKAYLPLCRAWQEGRFPSELPIKRIVNKEGTEKKRVVYSFEGDEGIFLKFIAFCLYRYDDLFCSNCYAFRRGIGAGSAVMRLRMDKRVAESYCLKVDVSNYFNSIKVEKLLSKLVFLKEEDFFLYQLFEKMLLEERVRSGDRILLSKRGD